uniref:AraC family transcriptional regulator n=1 Tax=uncultured Draconibacterium sp. TaxID=1573823 RepID=UPI003216DE6B
MAIKEWKTSNFKAQLIQLKSSKEIQVSGNTEDNKVVLHFVQKGETSLMCGNNHSYKMNENTNNTFSTLEENVNHTFSKNKQYEFFKVFIPFNFIHSIGSQNPEVFAPIVKSLEKQWPLISQGKYCLTTMEMQEVINQIRACQSMGNFAPLYFENKVKELFLLQLQQRNSQKCSTCNRYNHYNLQVNEARNIIENQYQNPPTINELATAVGMSATILKSSFKLFFGTTIYGYLFDYRMNIAYKLLHNTSYTIAEIADRSGYEHASHFATAFKRKYGASPVTFRKKVA